MLSLIDKSGIRWQVVVQREVFTVLKWDLIQHKRDCSWRTLISWPCMCVVISRVNMHKTLTSDRKCITYDEKIILLHLRIQNYLIQSPTEAETEVHS